MTINLDANCFPCFQDFSPLLLSNLFFCSACPVRKTGVPLFGCFFFLVEKSSWFPSPNPSVRFYLYPTPLPLCIPWTPFCTFFGRPPFPRCRPPIILYRGSFFLPPTSKLEVQLSLRSPETPSSARPWPAAPPTKITTYFCLIHLRDLGFCVFLLDTPLGLLSYIL